MRSHAQLAFTRFEIVVVSVVLAVLGFVFVPYFAEAESSTRISTCADQLDRITQAFDVFHASNGYWPPDTVVGKLPPEMRSVFKGENPFQGETPIGGQFDYELLDDTGVVCIVIRGSGIIEPPALDDAMALDEWMDDGDLRSGNFRKVADGYALAFSRD
jgi:hypothetical protein